MPSIADGDKSVCSGTHPAPVPPPAIAEQPSTPADRLLLLPGQLQNADHRSPKSIDTPDSHPSSAPRNQSSPLPPSSPASCTPPHPVITPSPGKSPDRPHPDFPAGSSTGCNYRQRPSRSPSTAPALPYTSPTDALATSFARIPKNFAGPHPTGSPESSMSQKYPPHTPCSPALYRDRQSAAGSLPRTAVPARPSTQTT